MKAVVIEAPGTMSVQDVPEPVLGDYQARCDILFGSVCSGTDRHLISGDLPFRNWVQYPALLGHESIGRVTELGPKCKHLKVGDVVVRVGAPASEKFGSNWGGFAEQGVAHDWQSMQDDGLPQSAWKPHQREQLLPADIDPAAATMFITWRETLSYTRRIGIKKGTDLLVMGSGGNGLSFAAHGRNLGAATRVMIGSPSREADASRIDITSYHSYRDEEVAARVLEQYPDRFDIVIDSVGSQKTVDTALKLLRPNGRIGIYGFDGEGDVKLSWKAAPGSFTVHKEGYDEAQVHDEVIELVRAGKLDASVWLDLDHPFSLDQIHDAIDAIHSKGLIKPLVKIG